MKKIALAAAATLALTACQTPSTTTTATTPATTTAAVVAGNTTTAPAAGGPKSTLTATVTFSGTVPAAKKIDTAADAFCAKTQQTEETVLAKDGKLQNVIVRVTKGFDGKAEVPTTPAVIQQDGCRYVPHVVGAVAGQEISIVSKDDTTHNVHTYKGDESIFNRAQNKGQEIKKDTAGFKQDNGPISFKCDIHPWMTGYVVVNPNQFFAVTDATGLAKIDLPAGKYTLEAWHEKYGVKTAEVTVEAGKPAEVKFDFSGNS